MSQRLGKAAQALSGPKITSNLPHLHAPQRLVKKARGMNGSKTTLRPLQFASIPSPISRWGFKETKKPYEALPSTLDSLSDIETYLSKPSWSVKSLLKDRDLSHTDSPEITPKTLHHLLKLSALPQPENEEKESEMLATLRLQLHFVKEIQEVDASGVKPLSAIREETEEARKEITIGLDSLKEALANEETVGRMRRPRRKTDVPLKVEQTASMRQEDKIVSDGGFEWAPLKLAMPTHRKGQYYYMEYGDFDGDAPP